MHRHTMRRNCGGAAPSRRSNRRAAATPRAARPARPAVAPPPSPRPRADWRWPFRRWSTRCSACAPRPPSPRTASSRATTTAGRARGRGGRRPHGGSWAAARRPGATRRRRMARIRFLGGTPMRRARTRTRFRLRACGSSMRTRIRSRLRRLRTCACTRPRSRSLVCAVRPLVHTHIRFRARACGTGVGAGMRSRTIALWTCARTRSRPSIRTFRSLVRANVGFRARACGAGVRSRVVTLRACTRARVRRRLPVLGSCARTRHRLRALILWSCMRTRMRVFRMHDVHGTTCIRHVRRDVGKPHRAAQQIDVIGLLFAMMPGTPRARQADGPEAHALPQAHGHALRFPHAPHLALAAFAQHHEVPVIGALAARVDQRIEVRGAVIELLALAQALEYRVLDLSQYTHRVFAFDLAGGMHLSIGELAVVGEQQQAQRVEVEATHGDPASADAWQAIEYGRPSFRIGLTAYLAGGFVIHEHARPRLFHRRRRSDDAAIDAHDVAVRDTGAELRGRVVDGDASGAYPFFDAATRTHTGTRQPFL